MDRDTVTFVLGAYAAIATIGALGAALWAVREQRENNKLEKRNGDLQAELLQLERNRDFRSGPERRSAVASAVLFELDGLEPNLRRMWASKNAWGVSFIPRDVALESFIDHVELFRPTTVHAVLHLRGLVHDLRQRMPAGEAIDRKHDNQHRTWFMRTLAGVMVWAIHDARMRLLEEGGVIIPTKHDYRSLKEPDLPELPPEPAHLAGRAQLTLDAGRLVQEEDPNIRLLRAAEASEKEPESPDWYIGPK